MDNAKKFVDWALSKEGMEVAASVQSFQVPTNTEAAIPAEAIRPEDVKLIEYDFVTYGSEAKRKALISRWVEQVKPLER